MMPGSATRDWSPLPEAIWPLLDEVFDADWYRSRHTDIRWWRTSPEDHYRRFGFAENRPPGPLFDPEWYVASTPEAPAVGQPALLHFATADAVSRGEPNPLFDSRWIAMISGSDENPLLVYAADPALDPSPVFDTPFFARIIDVAPGQTPLGAYLSLTSDEDVSPCPLFDADAYRRDHPEAERALEHYLRFGGFAGASPCARLEGSAYTDRSPWVLTGSETPLAHFLKHGVRERTAWTPIGTAELVRDLIDDGEDAAAVFVLRRLRESETGMGHEGLIAKVSDARPSAAGTGCVVSTHAVLTADRDVLLLTAPRSENGIVIGRSGRAGIAMPRERRSLDGPASISVTGIALFDVVHGGESPVPAIIPTAIAPTCLCRFAGSDAITIAESEWVVVTGELSISTSEPTAASFPDRRVGSDDQEPLTLRVTTVARDAAAVVWPPAPGDDERVRNCTALDLDCGVPTSILLLAHGCAHVIVRTDRGAPSADWASACRAMGVSVEFRSHIERRRRALPSLSIGAVIPTYNHARFVGAAIESFLAQEHAVAEVVVVDDGSTDETAEVIRAFSDPRVRCLRTDRVGPGAALDAGVRVMESDVVAFLGSDDLALPHRAEHDLWMLRELEIDAIASLPVIIDESGVRRGDDAAGFLFPLENPRLPIDVLRLLWRDGNFICNPAVSMRREAYWRFGGSPHGLLHLHDFMLWVRLAGALRLGGSAERTTEYRRTRQAGSLSAERAGSRLQLELEWAFDRFFDSCEAAAFATAFGTELPITRRSAPSIGIDSIPLFLEHRFDFVRRKGVQKAISALEDEQSRVILRDVYGLTEQRIFEAGATTDIDGFRDAQRLFDVIRSRPPWR